MFNCPSCKSECKKLIAVNNTFNTNSGELRCENCHETKTGSKPGLHDIVAQNGKVKLTAGKAWEIKQRIKSPDDGKTCINKSTGRPTQF